MIHSIYQLIWNHEEGLLFCAHRVLRGFAGDSSLSVTNFLVPRP